MQKDIRVLMIEDNPADAAVLKKSLVEIKTVKISVAHATTLAEGLARAKTEHFDVVLLDLGLPDSKGQETFKRVTENVPALPVVILTVSDNDALAVQAINQGVQDYFVKGTVDERLLAQAIRYAIQRKRIERALRESEEQFRSTFENRAIAIAHLDETGRHIRVNQKLCDLLGYTGKELLQRSLQDITFHADLADDLALFGQLMRGEHSTHSSEKRFIRADGSLLWVSATRSLERPAGQPEYCISFIEGITARKRTEEALKTTAAELARSNQDLEQFANIASHDLQEPLRMVTGFLNLLSERYGPQLDDKAREHIGLAVDGSQRMSELIRDLLAYSRVGREDEEFAETDLQASLSSALGNLQASIEEAQAAITHDQLPTVKVEKSLMTRLLQNLIGNAIKYRARDIQPQIHVGARREERAWLLWVRDNGIGIRPEDRERVFMIFQRLHSRQQYPGTGIGLAICKRIVEHHCGRIWVESEVGKGSTFYFTIPDRD